MRGFSTLLSWLAVAAAMWAVYSSPKRETPWVLLAYLPVHFSFVVGCWLAEQRFEYTDWQYHFIYSVLGSVELLAIIAFCFVSIRAAGPAAMVFFFVIFALFFLLERPRFLPLFSLTYCFAGLLVLLSSVTASGDWRIACLSLGFFWLAEGLFHWFYAHGIRNGYREWITRAGWVPMVIAICCFSWMAWKIGSHQRELAAQALPEIHAAERVAQ